MRTLITLLLATIAFGQDQTPLGPKPIPAERHELLSRLMLRATIAQINLYAIRDQPVINTDQLRAAERERDGSARAWKSMLEAYQREFNAQGCELSIDKKWECPKATGSSGNKIAP